MMPKLTLYSRQNCCLCDEMKTVIAHVGATMPIDLVVVDVDSSVDLRDKFGDEVPVLFIDGRKAFKYRVSVAGLKKQLKEKNHSHFTRLARAIGKDTS